MLGKYFTMRYIPGPTLFFFLISKSSGYSIGAVYFFSKHVVSVIKLLSSLGILRYLPKTLCHNSCLHSKCQYILSKSNLDYVPPLKSPSVTFCLWVTYKSLCFWVRIMLKIQQCGFRKQYCQRNTMAEAKVFWLFHFYIIAKAKPW